MTLLRNINAFTLIKLFSCVDGWHCFSEDPWYKGVLVLVCICVVGWREFENTGDVSSGAIKDLCGNVI